MVHQVKVLKDSSGDGTWTKAASTYLYEKVVNEKCEIDIIVSAPVSAFSYLSFGKYIIFR